MLIRRVQIAGRGPFDVLIRGERIAAIAPAIDQPAETDVIDGRGAALLPGLHDHHIHLFALAAAQQSVTCGPPDVRNAAELETALGASQRSSGGWIRGVGYHESVAGPLDRVALDRLLANFPVRIQHRSGIAWFLNGAAVRELGLDGGTDAPGVERDARGLATGRLFRCDAWLRERLGEKAAPSLAAVSQRLARYGVTGVTDATAANGPAEHAAFVSAITRGELVQSLWTMGGDDLRADAYPTIHMGARKILLDEAALPSFDELLATIERAHAAGRGVAIHCVTRAELVLACAALKQARGSSRDRIEHASLAAPEVLELLAESKATVVTQPGFVYERGDQYLRDVEPESQPWLYRAAGLLSAGIALGAGTDAPFGSADPWLAIRAAVTRTTRDRDVLGPEERLSPERALALFTSPPDSPGSNARTVSAGSAADLCLLDRDWAAARESLSSDMVRATIRAGRCVSIRD